MTFSTRLRIAVIVAFSGKIEALAMYFSTSMIEASSSGMVKVFDLKEANELDRARGGLFSAILLGLGLIEIGCSKLWLISVFSAKGNFEVLGLFSLMFFQNFRQRDHCI